MAGRGVAVAAAVAVAAGGVVGITSLTGDDDASPVTTTTATAPVSRQAEPRATTRFVDAHNPVPPGWTGPAFKLSQNYPATMPALSPAPWRQLSFRTQPLQYINAVLKYSLEGNTEVDFLGQDNAVRKWFHAPWMDAGPAGREFIHGLTRERPSPPGDLATTQTETTQSWAVSLYNPRGGFTFGQVWKDHDAPDPTKARFPEGTVSFKLLFTTAPVSQVPQLKNSLEWEADINRATGNGPRPKLRLLQIDVAVRDRRANSTTGWVMGTFVHNGNGPGATVWDRMVPVGVMWGNDPLRLNDNGPLKETFINPAAKDLVTHLGRGGRLNGPIDNKRSSCLSCHSTGQIPSDLSRSNVPGPPPVNASNAVIAQYFRNIKAQTPFTPGMISLDYSLQLQVGIANWARARATRNAAPRSVPRRGELRATKDVEVRPVER